MRKSIEQILGNDYSDSKSYTLITGACGGLGRAFVSECAKNSENLILIGTSSEKLSNLCKEFAHKFNGIFVRTFVCDLSSTEQISTLVNKLKEEKIQIVKLINNAGVIIEGGLERFSDEQVEKAIKVNCIGTLELTKKLIRERNKAFKFEVLTVTSLAANFPIPYMSVYAATKSFLVSIMTALSYEYKSENIVFTTICPGGMETTKEMKESIKSMGLGGKLSCLSTEKVAKKALKALKKKKKLVTPGFFNKFLVFLSKFCSKPFLAKCSGNIYKKSQIKRNF